MEELVLNASSLAIADANVRHINLTKGATLRNYFIGLSYLCGEWKSNWLA